MNIKHQLYHFCLEHINHRLNVCQQSINQIQESLKAETKSSAGDKHETGRAMIQLEREQIGQQLKKLEKEKDLLLKINPDINSKTIQLGSVIFAKDRNYFIGPSIGKIELENHIFYAISTHAPIGQQLMGKQVGNIIKFRNEKFEILKIL